MVSSWQYMGLGSETAHQRRSETGCTWTLVKLKRKHLARKKRGKLWLFLWAEFHHCNAWECEWSLFVQGRITVLRALGQILKVLVARRMDLKATFKQICDFFLMENNMFWGCWVLAFFVYSIRKMFCFVFSFWWKGFERWYHRGTEKKGKVTLGPVTCMGILQYKEKGVV